MFNLSYREYLLKYGKVQKVFLLPVELDYWRRSVAENEGISMTALVRGILEDYKAATTGEE